MACGTSHIDSSKSMLRTEAGSSYRMKDTEREHHRDPL